VLDPRPFYAVCETAELLGSHEAPCPGRRIANLASIGIAVSGEMEPSQAVIQPNIFEMQLISQMGTSVFMNFPEHNYDKRMKPHGAIRLHLTRIGCNACYMSLIGAS
jgi:hypothetical protein